MNYHLEIFLSFLIECLIYVFVGITYGLIVLSILIVIFKELGG